MLREVAERLASAAAQVDTTDGLRVTQSEGWWLLRASGTEPKLTIRCEAADEPGLERLREAVGAHLQACGISLGERARGAVAAGRSRLQSTKAR